jgi:hypothetical protein
MPLDTGCTSYVERRVGSRGLTALLGLGDDPDNQRDERATSATQNSSANSMPKRPPPIMEPMLPIMEPPPRIEPNRRTTIAPTRAPRSIFKPSLMAYYTSILMVRSQYPKQGL